MSTNWPKVKLAEGLRYRKDFITIDDLTTYKRPRVQLHAQGIILRDEIPGALIKTKQQQVCRSGEFLVAEIDAKVGGFGIVPKSLDGAIVSSHYFLYVLDDSKLDRNFLDYFSRTPTFSDQIAAQGSTNYAAIRPRDVLNYEIPLPPLNVQRGIVTRIEELLAQIAGARLLRKKAEKEAESIICAMLRYMGSRFQVEGKLSQALAAPPRNGWSAQCDNAEDGIPVLALSAVTGFRYRPNRFKRTSLPAPMDGHFWLKPGDLLITRSNAPEFVGHAAIYDGNPSPCIYPDLMMRLELREEAADRRFVWYWLQAPLVREFIRQNAKGTSPTMKKIAQGTVMAIPFPSSLPVSEQRRIVEELDGLQVEVDALKRLQAETASELDALLPSILDKEFKGGL